MQHTRSTDHALRREKRKKQLERQQRNAAERADPMANFRKEAEHFLSQEQTARKKREEQIGATNMRRAVRKTYGSK